MLHIPSNKHHLLNKKEPYMMTNHHQFSFILCILLLLAATLSAELCHPDDKKTLFQIKKAFNNPYIFASWTPNTDCCGWYSVKCDETTHRITSFVVSKDSEVSGPIPNAIGNLPYLQELIFSHVPNLNGPIPNSISKLKNLNYLWLSHNNLTGSIPDFIGSLTKLTYINLSVNRLTGPLPPSLSSLHSLSALFLECNHLTGPIPGSYSGFQKIPDFYLKLAKNRLSGPLPPLLGAVNFTILDLSRNMLSGDASVFFGKNKGLETVDISRNKFSFDLTKVEFPSALSNLELSHNKIYGSLPDSLAKLPSLFQFNASYNRLCGQIPAAGALKRFDEYSFAHNKCLCGSPLPPCK